MLIIRKFLIFGVVYALISLTIFLGGIFLWPGFPFFPKTVYRTDDENSSLHLTKGFYYILFFVHGPKEISINRKDVGPVAVSVAAPDGKQEALPLSPSNFYFAEDPDNNGIKGHSVCSFNLPVGKQITLQSSFRAHGYEGLIIRTGFGEMIASIVIFEIITLFLSGVLTHYTLSVFDARRVPTVARPPVGG